VDDNIYDALGILKEGLSSIKAETDPQGDDILKICSFMGGVQSGCIGPAALDEALKSIDSARKYMKQPYSVPVGDTTIRVDFAAFFRVQDYKKMLPHYAFYDAGLWGPEKPIFYFTTPAGQETGNLKTVDALMERAYDEDWSTSRTIDSLKRVIRWQDPTFQGFLPGATEARLWRIIQIAAEYQEPGYDYTYSAKAESKTRAGSSKRLLSLPSFLNPRFPLLLLRN
jgi:hypothetical protein